MITYLYYFFDKNVKNPVETARDSAQKSAEEIFQGAAQLREAATRGVTEFTDTARRVFGRAATEVEDERVDQIAAAFAPPFAQIQAELEQQIETAQDNGSAVVDPLIERLSQKLYEVRLQMAALHEAAKNPQTTGETPESAPDAEAVASVETP